MRMQHSFREDLAAGKTKLGAWLTAASPDMAELLALSGLDFLLIDQEHGQATLADAVAMMRAMKGTPCLPILRVEGNDPIAIKRALDAGAQGIMVPMIDTAAEAKAAVAACKYPPFGNRGAFGAMRGSSYGFDSGYHDAVSDEVLIILQIETPEAIENLPEIAAVEGIDVLFIGQRDLSAALGQLNRFQHPEVVSATREAEKKILASGRPLGSVAASGKDAKAMIERGFSFLIAGSDVMFLRQGVLGLLNEVRSEA